MKFAQHIDWHLPFPPPPPDPHPFTISLDSSKPRHTLAELFQSVPSDSFSSSSSSSPSPLLPSLGSEFGGIRRSTSSKKSSENGTFHSLPSSKKSSKSGPLSLLAKPDARPQPPSNQSHRSSSTQVHHGSDEENMFEPDQIPTMAAHERNKPSAKSCDLGQILQKPDATPDQQLLYGGSSNKKPSSVAERREANGYFWQSKVLHRKGTFLADGKGRRGRGGAARVQTTVEIPEKMLGLAWVGTAPVLLPQGSHSFPAEGFVLEEVVSEKTSFLKHGHLHRVRIKDGHLGVAWVDGKAMLLEAGTSVHSCPSGAFSYVATDDKMLSEKEFVLGPFRVVTVADCEVGIKFCNREPRIMYSGRHCLSISRLEVFAGFESLSRRESTVRGATATSNDNKRMSADIWMEWQIKPEDAATARAANVTDVEGAVCDKVRRAFNLAMWEVNANDIAPDGALSTFSDPHPVLKKLSGDILRECMDLFEEGWAVTLWDLQVRELMISEEAESSEDQHR